MNPRRAFLKRIIKTACVAPWLSLTSNGALDFNGASDYIVTSSSPVSTFPLSLFCWFNNDTQTDQAAFSICANSGNEYMYVGWNSTSTRGALASTRSGSTFTRAQTGVNPATGTWHSLLGVFTDASNRKVYCDFNSATTGLSGTSTPTGINRIVIGAVLSSGSPLAFTNSRLAECAIWNVALTDAESTALSKGFKPSLIRPSALVFYAPLVRETQDLRGGLTLSVTGTAVATHPRRIG